MKYFYVSPQDARWLRRWLLNNLVGVVAIVGVIMVIRVESSVPDVGPHQVISVNQVVGSDSSLLHKPTAVAPEGWRRTSSGWQHVSTWRKSSPPIAVVDQQESIEPTWIDQTLQRIQGVPPLMFALIQITAIAAIVNIAGKEQDEHEQPIADRE
ncbi:MAG: hypothetical protein AB8B91_18050 [Rubripirellula sp.]